MFTTEFNEDTNKMLLPQIMYDIEDIGEMLTEKEMYIFVNLSDYTDPEDMQGIINVLNSYSTSYASIRIRKISNKHFACWSEHE